MYPDGETAGSPKFLAEARNADRNELLTRGGGRIVEPPISTWEPLAQKPMFAPPDDRKACPCGDEFVDGLLHGHVVGLQCRARIEGVVRHRFGPHRFGGRFSDEVEDFVQDCYARLSRPETLESFRPPPDRPLAGAFRAWLSGVAHNHCNNVLKSRGIFPTSHGKELERPVAAQSKTAFKRRYLIELAKGDELSEPMDAETPESAFAQQYLKELAEAAIGDVEARWKEKGWSLRFDVVLPLVLKEDDDYEPARQRLNITCNHARQLKFRLLEEIRNVVRARVMDELFLEPGLSPANIEARISQFIAELLRDAFPGKDIRTPGFFSIEPEPEPDAKPEGEEPPSESKP